MRRAALTPTPLPLRRARTRRTKGYATCAGEANPIPSERSVRRMSVLQQRSFRCDPVMLPRRARRIGVSGP